jgi:hypothetical protein
MLYQVKHTSPQTTHGSFEQFANNKPGTTASKPAPEYSKTLQSVIQHVLLTELPQRAPDADVTDLLPFNFAKHGGST